MSDTGWQSPGTTANDTSSGTPSWSNTDNIKSSNDNYASITNFYQDSNLLQAYNFGFSIPSGSTIDGIEVRVEKKGSASNTPQDVDARLLDSDGNTTSEDKAKSGDWPTSDTYITYGGDSDLWSETWSASDINDSDFGFSLQAKGDSPFSRGDVYVDHIQMKVYYTPSDTSASLSPSISSSISSSISPSTSLSPSVSPSLSASLSPSISPSISPSLSASISPSISPSISSSISPSASLSPSLSSSISSSISSSASLSPSISASISSSLSPSISPSPSASISPSISASISSSISPSASISPSISSSISPSASLSPSLSSSISRSISPSISSSISPSASLSPSLSSSVSPSLSPSLSASISPSPSPSLSPSISASISSSISPSASLSPSLSPSLSASISPSISPSISSSISPSPSPGTTDYTRGDYADLPGDDTNLETEYTAQEVTDVSSSNDTRVCQSATEEHSIHQFKAFAYDGVRIICELKTSYAPSSSTVYLQAYNQDTTTWDNVDTNNTADANTDFMLSGTIADTTNYKSDGLISCRVYQEAA